MTTTTTAARRGTAPERPPRVGRTSWLDRPLTSYYLILGSAGLLLLLGLVMVLSASSVKSYVDYGTAYTFFRKQLLWVALGLPALWLGLVLRVRAYRMMAYPVLLISAAMLILVLVPGIGVSTGGSTRWLDLGIFRLQPSELAKVAVALWGADLLVRKHRVLTRSRHLLIPLVPVASLIALLVMLEPDLGTTICLVIVVFALLFLVGAPLRIFATVCAVTVGLILVAIAVEPYRASRAASFLHPFDDPEKTGFQAVQGIYSLSSGGWWGVGLGGSSGKWNVPHAYTDYIFAIIGEELGLMGALVVLGLFAIYGYAGIRIACRTADPFARLAAGAVTAWVIGQALINIGYVVGLLPVTGIPLPLISFGGTSLILAMFVTGMLASFARSEPAAAAAIAARGPTRLARLLRLPAPQPPDPVRLSDPRPGAQRGRGQQRQTQQRKTPQRKPTNGVRSSRTSR
ncbi:MAG: putative lipid II flippase FtsW [Mycobacteriales bacterium]